MKKSSFNDSNAIQTFEKSNKVKTQRYCKMKQALKTKYDINVLEDVVLSQPGKIILFADLNNKNDIKLEVVTGTLEIIGFEDKSSIKLSEILTYFDYDNGYAKVSGSKSYYTDIHNALCDFDNQPNVTFPIKNKKGKYWLQFNLIPLQNKKDLASVFLTNVTDVLSEEEALFVKTHHDSLTGVFNKYTLDYHYGKRYKCRDFHVLYLDIDNFKQLNDTLGHQAGNAFLVEFANLIKTYESDFNRFYRIGGDEFIGLFFEKSDTIKKMASEIITKTRTFSKNYISSKTSVSIGIVKAEERDDVITKADKLLYKVKENGKNHYLYDIESNIKIG